MTKKQILKALENVEEYHMEQMEKITLFVEGKRVKDLPPLMKEECDVGKWLYGDAVHIEKLIGLQFYKTMQLIHEYWHLKYETIYDIYHMQEEQETLLRKVFFIRPKLLPEVYEDLLECYHDLKRTSEDLIEEINASKRRILALKERVFSKDD